VWEKITKKKLGIFKSANISTEIRVGDKVVKIKEERGLLQRFIVICRCRPELDLKEGIGTYEYGVVPRSLFASDGSFLLAYDKDSILHHLEKLTRYPEQGKTDRNETTESEPPGNQSVHVPLQSSSYNIRTFRCADKSIISILSSHHRWNGCGKLTKTDHQMKMYQDFADSFLVIICNIL